MGEIPGALDITQVKGISGVDQIFQFTRREGNSNNTLNIHFEKCGIINKNNSHTQPPLLIKGIKSGFIGELLVKVPYQF